jgi:inner membrane protein
MLKSELGHWRYSVGFKLLFSGILILILLIPLGLVDDLVSERQNRQAAVIEEIGQIWGRSQLLVGPMIAIPYRTVWKDDKDKIHTEQRLAWFLPDELQINARIEPQIRHRGIFEAVVYRLELEVTGKFSPPDFTAWKIPAADILWEGAIVAIPISDTRGIHEDQNLVWDGQTLEFLSGTGSGSYFHQGLHVRLPISLSQETRPHDFAFKLGLNGSERVQFVPIGKRTVVNLSSTWPDPSFQGEFLPVQQTVNDTGFTATWQIAYLARSYPQQWYDTETESQLDQTAFGVTLLIPVDFYQKTERAVKYGILFLFLTFLAFFLFEVLSTLRIHTFQYLLVGAALIMFFLLLLSLSEQIGFSLAYLLAASAVILLISAYAGKILASRQRTLLLSSLLTGLYVYLYILLHLQDYALLLGSVGLFLILASVMYFTRNVDWYAVNLPARSPTTKD